MSQKPAPRKITLEPAPTTIRVEFAGQTVAESDRALILREGSYPPVAYIPKADVQWELLTDSDHHTFCPYKGTAQYWSISAGERVAENALWGYPEAIDAVADIRDCVAFYWDRVDAWYLGGEPLAKPAF
jgi:uncharacterized protein (DUF427 family)